MTESGSGNSSCDDSNNRKHNKVLQYASRDFAMTLKIQMITYTYGHSKQQQTDPVVADIASTRFMQFCDKASPNYEPSYLNYDELAGKSFQHDKVWIS